MLSPELWNVRYRTFLTECLLGVIDEYLFDKFFGLTLAEIEMTCVVEEKEESIVKDWDWIEIPDDVDDFGGYIIV